MNKKNLITLLILGILVLAIPLGLNLLHQQQILKSKATEDPILFKDAQGNPLPERNGIPFISGNSGIGSSAPVKVKIQLTSPLGPAAQTN